MVIRSNIDRGSRMKVGSVIRLRSAPGRSCEMMWVRTAAGGGSLVFVLQRHGELSEVARRTIALLGVDDGLVFAGNGRVVAAFLGRRAAA